MTLDAKTALHTLIEIAEELHEKMEHYVGCKGVPKSFDEALEAYKSAVTDLRYEIRQ